jgi:hypothetical protein
MVERPYEPKELKVHVGAPPTGNGPHWAAVKPTWNTGDIDFEKDGSIFIRNPYLADAIQEQLRINAARYDPKDPKSVLFRLTRDQGWSGEKQNLVC